MNNGKYLKIMVDEIKRTVAATIGEDGHPVTRTIDLMMYDEDGVYFLTGKGGTFYKQLIAQKFVAFTSCRDMISITLRGDVKEIGTGRLKEIFEQNPFMKEMYPDGGTDALEVFQLYHGDGQFFDITDPQNVVRSHIVIG